MKLGKRWRIVLIASFLAFFMEYSLRGISVFIARPRMAVFVLLNYVIYIALMEELIGRFKLNDSQAWVVAAFFGILQVLGISHIYYPPFIFGINLPLLLINNVVWWPTLQTIFAFYIARRITPDVDRTRPMLSTFGVVSFFILYLLVLASWRMLAAQPTTAWQLMILVTLGCFFGVVSLMAIRTNIKIGVKVLPFARDKVLDTIAVIMTVFLTILFVTPSTAASAKALRNPATGRSFAIVTVLIGLALLLRRVLSKRAISI